MYKKNKDFYHKLKSDMTLSQIFLRNTSFIVTV